MLDPYLTPALTSFTALTLNLPDEALDIAWGWRDYTGEGVRFAFFRTLEELEDLTVTLHTTRARTAPLTLAQNILGQYHTACMDLRAVCLGVDDETATRAPTEGEWPARTALAHIVGADLGFYGVISFAREHHRAGTWSPEAKLQDADWDRLLDLTEAQYDELLNSPFNDLQAAHQDWHMYILNELATLTNDELEKPTGYWEKDLYPLRFRLGRFASHMRQHTVQIEKILNTINGPPNETRRLLRLLYRALAGVGAATLGMAALGQDERQALATTLNTRTDQVAEALLSETSSLASEMA